MSKTRIGIAVVVLATLLSSAAMARARLGIGPLGVARFAVTRVLSLGGLHHARGLARHGQIRTASLRSQDVRSVMDPGSATRRYAGKSSLLQRWRAGTAVAPRTPGGGMATADMDGSGRCIGRSPFTTSTTTRSGAMASASGTTAILTSMPRSLCLTAMRSSPPMWDRARTAEDLAGSLGCRSSAAMTEAKLPASPSIRFERRYSRMRRSAPLWTILPTH